MITVTKNEFIEQIRGILLKLVEDGETIEITDNEEVIAHVVPVSASKQFSEQDIHAFGTGTDRLADKISAYLPEKVDAVEIVRGVRRDL